jgi:hypothetical protein
MIKTLLVSGFFFMFPGCEKNSLPEGLPKGIPVCVENKIIDIADKPVWNPPAKIYSYQFKGQTVYYFSSRCCDIPSMLYDENCNFICSPDGGLTGSGDGQCSDFFSLRTNEKLIWEDTRK